MDVVPSLVKTLKGMPRPDTDEYFLLLALLASTRGTCSRRRVGCVLTDANNHVISTGYNAPASGRTHCIEIPCAGATMASGTGLSECEALHAEENALIQCTRPNDIWTVYSTTSPCIHCVRRLMNTRAHRIVFAEVYPHPKSELEWTTLPSGQPAGRLWIHKPWGQLRSIANILAATLEPGQSSSSTAISAMGMQSLKADQSPGSRTQSSSMDQGADSPSKQLSSLRAVYDECDSEAIRTPVSWQPPKAG